MRVWDLKSGEPLSLTLAADARLSHTDYCDDQIWELQLGDGDPPALALYTTYGLRARSLRIFPLFTEDDLTISDPGSFDRPPKINQFFPNYMRLTFSPFPSIDVEIEYWVPSSKAIGGRINIANNGRFPRKIRLDVVALLTPSEGQRMAPANVETAPCLVSYTDGLAPVVFLTGGPQAISSPYPALRLDVDLQSRDTRRLTFSHAALPSLEDSFSMVRGITARPWDAETARLVLSNAGQVEIYTGNADWDVAFALTQKLALNLFLSPTEHLQNPSFVLTREPDQGYSLQGDGRDYNHLWNGQPPLESFYLTGIILPCAPQLAKGLLRNFLSSQTKKGSVDWKPGLAGQRCHFLATPILASMAWLIYQWTEDRTFLEKVFPLLLDFLNSWFSPDHDRDGDGIPEWDHPTQADLEDHHIFSRWDSWAHGVDIAYVESPALCAFLYKECQSLIKIATLINSNIPVDGLVSLADNLRTVLENAWSSETASYRYWDRDTHSSPSGELIGERNGSGILPIQRHFEDPIRLLVHLRSDGESTLRPNFFVHGESISGQHRVERIGASQFRWFHGFGTLTGQRVYSSLEHIDINGLDDNVQVKVFSVGYDFQDHANLLPLWAGIPDDKRAETLVRETLTSPKHFWRPYGLPACPDRVKEQDDDQCRNVHLPWNNLIGEGLLSYGYQAEAAELVSRLMKAVTQTLKGKRAFQRYYNADNGQGSGERNALSGLAPLNLFLESLGVRLISSSRVHLTGFNPFPWPVTIKYHGMSVLCKKDSTTVTFPDGQSVVVEDPSPQYVSLISEKSDLD